MNRIRRILVAAWAALMLPGPAAAGQGAAAAEHSVLRRTTVLVSDMDASIGFYRDVLGMSVWLDRSGQSKDGKRDLPLTAASLASRLVIMKGKDPWIGMIGLLAFGQPQLADNRVVPDKLGVGDMVLMIETDNVDDVAAKVAAGKGGKALSRPQSFQITAGDGSILTSRNIFLADPDGFVLEVVQRRAAAPEAAK